MLIINILSTALVNPYRCDKSASHLRESQLAEPRDTRIIRVRHACARSYPLDADADADSYLVLCALSVYILWAYLCNYIYEVYLINKYEFLLQLSFRRRERAN